MHIVNNPWGEGVIILKHIWILKKVRNQSDKFLFSPDLCFLFWYPGEKGQMQSSRFWLQMGNNQPSNQTLPNFLTEQNEINLGWV